MGRKVQASRVGKKGFVPGVLTVRNLLYVKCVSRCEAGFQRCYRSSSQWWYAAIACLLLLAREYGNAAVSKPTSEHHVLNDSAASWPPAATHTCPNSCQLREPEEDSR